MEEIFIQRCHLSCPKVLHKYSEELHLSQMCEFLIKLAQKCYRIDFKYYDDQDSNLSSFCNLPILESKTSN